MVKRKREEGEGQSGSSKKAWSADVVEQVNALKKSELLSRTEVAKPNEHNFCGRDFAYTIDLIYAEDLTKKQLKTCFDLIETTSRHDYEPSSFGWHPKRKLREMKEKEMRYLLVHRHEKTPPPPGKDAFSGFMSFMFTHDSSPAVPVLYIYEIHLVEEARGQLLGKELMHCARELARSFHMAKVMLTCFKSNTNAYTFYERLGFKIDACSPRDIKTRNKVSESDYVIMSLDLVPAIGSPQSVESACVEEDAQVTEDDGGESSAMFADLLASPDEVLKSLGICVQKVQDENTTWSTEGNPVCTGLKALHERDFGSLREEAAKLQRMIESLQSRLYAGASFQIKVARQQRVVQDDVEILAEEASEMGIMLPMELLEAAEALRECLADPQVENFCREVDSNSSDVRSSQIEADFERKKKELEAYERKVKMHREQLDKEKAQMKAREKSLTRREHNMSLALTYIEERTRQLEGREAAMKAATQITAAQKFIDNGFVDESGDEDEAASQEQSDEEDFVDEEEVSATNTDYSEMDNSEARIAESDSEGEKPQNPAGKKAGDLPTPEAMKWQRPNRDKVSTWLRRSGSARDSFPSGLRPSV